MSVQVVQDRLDSYSPKVDVLEEEHALREITQEIILAALGRTDFFQKVAFHGGTCLRIFYGLRRFSEDLDFALAAAGYAIHARAVISMTWQRNSPPMDIALKLIDRFRRSIAALCPRGVSEAMTPSANCCGLNTNPRLGQ